MAYQVSLSGWLLLAATAVAYLLLSEPAYTRRSSSSHCSPTICSNGRIGSYFIQEPPP
jgi:hypothetical protein